MHLNVSQFILSSKILLTPIYLLYTPSAFQSFFCLTSTLPFCMQTNQKKYHLTPIFKLYALPRRALNLKGAKHLGFKMYIYLNLSIERPLLETGVFATSCQVERTKMLRLLLFVAVCACAVLASKRTLVLVDNWSIRETHSVYFRTLRGEFISTCLKLSKARQRTLL